MSPVLDFRHLLARTLATLVLACALFAAYSNSFRVGFTQDSGTIILEDPRLRTASRQNLKLIFQENYWWPSAESGLYRPLTTLSYLVNYSVLNNEDRPEGYHWINFLLHSCNAYLVYLLAYKLMRSPLPAFFTAALWALHPICIEAVTNIVGRADELAAMAVLTCLLLYIRTASALGWWKMAGLFAMMLAAIVGVLSKESAVVVAALVPLYDFTYRIARRRIKPVRDLIADFAQNSRVYITLAPALSVLVYAHFAMFGKPRAVTLSFVDNPILGAGFAAGRLTALKVIGKYLWLLIWPESLSCDYSFNSVPLVNWPFRSWEDWQVLAASGAVVAVLLFGAVCYRRNPPVFFLDRFLCVSAAANCQSPVAHRIHYGGALLVYTCHRFCRLCGARRLLSVRKTSLARGCAGRDSRCHRDCAGDAHLPAQCRLEQRRNLVGSDSQNRARQF